jgi:formylglycine-generating enzyme required for sulfatase activity
MNPHVLPGIAMAEPYQPAAALPPGNALLVSGASRDHESTPSADRDRVDRLHAQVNELLLASEMRWSVRRLSPRLASMHQPTRAVLKRALTELASTSQAVVLLSLAGHVAMTADGPAWVTGEDWRRDPGEATLPLSAIAEALADAGVVASVILLDLYGHPDDTDIDPEVVLNALQGGPGARLVALRQGSVPGVPLARVLVELLRGHDLDATSGTVTIGSLAEALARHAPQAPQRLQGPLDQPVAVPPANLDEFFDADRLASPQQPVVPQAALDDPIGPLAEDALIGQVLPGRFAIVRELARGGYGVVYVARQVSVDRDVALKVLHRRASALDSAARLFITEIRAIGRIVHPHIVRIYQADRMLDGRLFYAMELVPGPTLRQLLGKRGRIEPERAVTIARQLLSALTAAHAAHVVHADIKPSNIVVRPAQGEEPERAVLLDFGVSRLQSPGDEGSDVLAGTPAYMAPEQFRTARIDARCDVYAVGLVLLEMLTGWRRRGTQELAPDPLPADLTDPVLRTALTRALTVDPERRYPTAAAFAAALAGRSPSGAAELARQPFHFLTPLLAEDALHLAGRQADLHRLTDLVLAHRCVVLTAASGVGKTSLLRAGLMVRLRRLRLDPMVLTCRGEVRQPLLDLLAPADGGVRPTLASAVRTWQARHGQRPVVVIDQLEVLLAHPHLDASAREAELDALAELLAAPTDLCLVLAVREDLLAGLTDVRAGLTADAPILRLRPLDAVGAREAITRPLLALGVTVQPALLDRLVRDLQLAARGVLGQMPGAILPTHLQLACWVLFQGLAPDARVLDEEAYLRVGGLATILADHLERVLDRQLAPSLVPVARALFIELATAHQTRLPRTRAELVAALQDRHPADLVARVLQVLEGQRLILALDDSVLTAARLELAHDSLVPRVLAWAENRDLPRRRAAELVRFHLHRSEPGAPSLLSEPELREVTEQPQALAQLQAEWKARAEGKPVVEGPEHLVQHARRVHARRRRQRWAVLGLLAVMAVVTAGFAARDHERKAANRGSFRLDVAVFDLEDIERAREVPGRELPNLRIELSKVGPWLGLEPGEAADPGRFESVRLATEGTAAFALDVAGGPWALVVHGRERAGEKPCNPSVLWHVELPGYAEAEQRPRVRIAVPSCRATWWNAVEVPAGRYVSGRDDPADPQWPERVVRMSTYVIDRQETSNAEFNRYLHGLGGIDPLGRLPVVAAPQPAHPHFGEARHPVVNVNWFAAREYCLWMGKQLPTLAQVEKVARGGVCLDGDATCGHPNPLPKRLYPWGDDAPDCANRKAAFWGKEQRCEGTDPRGPFWSTVPVDQPMAGRAPYDVLHVAGNVSEWLREGPRAFGEGPRVNEENPVGKLDSALRMLHGGSWPSKSAGQLQAHQVEAIGAGNERLNVGMRCARGI